MLLIFSIGLDSSLSLFPWWNFWLQSTLQHFHSNSRLSQYKLSYYRKHLWILSIACQYSFWNNQDEQKLFRNSSWQTVISQTKYLARFSWYSKLIRKQNLFLKRVPFHLFKVPKNHHLHSHWLRLISWWSMQHSHLPF